MTDLFRTTYHRDGSVTIWNIYRQQWVRTRHPSDKVLATLNNAERVKVLAHISSSAHAARFARK